MVVLVVAGVCRLLLQVTDPGSEALLIHVPPPKGQICFNFTGFFIIYFKIRAPPPTRNEGKITFMNVDIIDSKLEKAIKQC